MTLSVRDLPSPNFDSREGCPVTLLVLHYTGMQTPQAAYERLCEPAAKVSAHYIVGEDGSVARLVQEEHRAWHAGVSSWRGARNINQSSIGVEIVNPGHEWGYRPFPQAQMRAVAELCQGILARHAIPPRNVVAHSDVAPARKDDPGELFDWAWLAGQGVGLWPEKVASYKLQVTSEPDLQLATCNSQLVSYGYDIADLPRAILAFQRHFRPEKLNGQWDGECQMRLAALLDMV